MERARRAAARRVQRAAYFRAYYARHREAIQAKNRRWLAAHRERVAERRRERVAGRPPPSARCVDCGVALARGERCERCRARYRYRTDPAYRARRLATSARWWARTRPPPRREEDAR